MALVPSTLASLQTASNAGVKIAMNRVASNLSVDHWFAQHHVYRASPSVSRYERLQRDIRDGNVNDEALAEYVSVSAPTHTLDGWSLLGRSVNCLLMGDPYNAVHLAYYAELRATIAILASEGIGIFNQNHCIVDRNGNCQLIQVVDKRYNRNGNPYRARLGTHECAWSVFEWWANEGRSIDVLRQVIKPDRRDLGTWIDATTKSGFSFEAIGSEWLKLWGIDVKQFFGDRDSRNDVSYWPNTINSWGTRTVFEQCLTISDIWAFLEPEPESRFAMLDRHLLRNVLYEGFRSATDDETVSTPSPDGFDGEIRTIFRNLGLNGSTEDYWRNFLTDSNLEDPIVLQLAGKQSILGGETHVLEVISRATMLLRLATGASADLLFDAGILREDISFWIESIGIDRGLWAKSDSPNDLYELWTDVQEELETWYELRQHSGLDIQTIWKQHTDSVTILSEYEKVALWGLGL